MSEVRIVGTTDPAEVAAVLAVLGRDGAPAQPSAYDRWRAQRLRALTRSVARRR